MHIGSRRCICNPASTEADHADFVERSLSARGFETDFTEGPGDAFGLARAAADADVSQLAVAGGDGTINGVVRGLAAAGHLGEVTLSVIPVGTANLLAGNIGITDRKHAVEVADTGDTRRVDVGVADGEPFLVSCTSGLPADASLAASGDLKARFGTLAFLLTGTQEAIEFDGLHITVDGVGAGGPFTWSGTATCLLVGNARKFVERGGQANMEDGRLDVAIVEQMPAGHLVAEAIGHRLLASDTEGVTHVRATDISIDGHGDPVTFSRDGELAEHEHLDMGVREQALTLRVGPDYALEPE